MKRKHQILIALFLIPLYLLTLINLFFPTRLVSADENRTLRQRPAFSLQELFSGQYTRSFEEYFSDQFPFRQFFINTSQQMLELLQAPLSGDVEIVDSPEQDLGIGERLEPDPADLVELPTDTSPPAITPAETSPGSQPSGSETAAGETTAAPAETTTPQETTATEAGPTEPAPSVNGKVDNYSSVIIVNNFAMELFGFSEKRCSRYASLVSRLQAKVPEARVFDLVAPTSIEFYSPAKYHSLSSSQKKAIQFIYGKLTNGVRPVDAYSEIVQHWQDYLYFRTDHHWTARGAYYAYRAFAATAGLEPIPLADFKTGRIEGDFLGTLYKLTKSSKLKSHPDFVEYFLPQVTSEGYAFNSIAMTEGYKIKAVYTKMASTNKYLAFIGGDNPLIRFKTSLRNGRRIVVLKESFGNALIPWLLNHYEEVYVIDPRLMKTNLPDFIRSHQIQDVLIINYAFSVGSARWVDNFETMIG